MENSLLFVLMNIQHAHTCEAREVMLAFSKFLQALKGRED